MKKKKLSYREEELWTISDHCICALSKMQYYGLFLEKSLTADTVLLKGKTYKLSYI